MSRFFRGGPSDTSSSESSSEDERPTQDKRSKFLRGSSDESSEDESEQEIEESEEEEEPIQQQKPVKGASRFIIGAANDSDSSSDDESRARVVKSAKDKKVEEIRSLVKSIQNGRKISDWVAVQTELDKLMKAYNKSILSNQQKPARFLIRTLVELEDAIKEASSNKDKKKMNALNAKSLNVLKQKLKKIAKEFEQELELFRQNPVTEEESMSEAERQNEADSESEQEEKEDKKKVQFEEEEDAGFAMVGKGGKAVLEMTVESFFKRLKELLEMRGKKNTDRLATVKDLKNLLEVAKSPYQKARVLLALIPAQFDYTASVSSNMTLEMWRNTASNINTVMQLIEKHTNILIQEGVDEIDDDGEMDKKASQGETVKLLGNLGSYVDRLDEEFIKSLLNIDPHTTEYIERLKDETMLYGLIVRTQKYYKLRNDCDGASALIAMRRVEHIYFKSDTVIKTIESIVAKQNPQFADLLQHENPIEYLCVELYKTNNDRIRTRNLLCHVYHHALHNRFHQARDMLLMSHLQETVQHADIQTQILYNRAIVQIGLCAFRLGMLREATNSLLDLCSSGKVKELLGQGFSSARYDRPEDKQDKNRQLPFHMHINLELLECIFMTCSMLLEIPNMAINRHDSRRKIISKPFRRMLDYNERQVFCGPPENTRDFVMAAAKSMASGEWEKARDLIHSIKIWNLLPNVEQIKEMLTIKIQEESLRTYLFTCSRFFDSISLESLSSMFGLSINKVYSIVSKMILNEELYASLDQPSKTVVLHRPGVDMTRLEYLAGMYSDKVSTFVENTEKLLETRSVSLGLANGFYEKKSKKVVDKVKPRR